MSLNATWESYKDVIGAAADRCHARGMQEVPWAVYAKYASEGCIEFARRSEVVFGTATMPLIPSQRLYTLPFDCVRPVGMTMLYPGDTKSVRLVPAYEKDLLDWQDRETTGKPYNFYYSQDRKSAGLWLVPQLGGFDGLSTAGTTTSITLETGASTDDDTYNDMTVTVLSGVAQGETSTVSDYDGATQVLTIADSLSVGIGARIQIGKEQLSIDYCKQGNPYTIQTRSGTVATTIASARYNLVPLADVSLPIDFFAGCEVRFSDLTTTTLLQGVKTRVVSSYSRTTGSALTVYPELPATPVVGDTCEINTIPNVPDDYHHFLSDYICFRVMERIDPRFASASITLFEKGVAEAKNLLTPLQGDEYEAIRGGYWEY